MSSRDAQIRRDRKRAARRKRKGAARNKGPRTSPKVSGLDKTTDASGLTDSVSQVDQPSSAEASCRLCGTVAPLLDSHIIPKFVYRYLRQSSPGRLRTSEAPNRLVQDGIKMPLLCAGCEARLNAWETPFADGIFLPFQTGKSGHAPVFHYQAWALKFAVSVSWRSVQLLRDRHARAGKELATSGVMGHLEAAERMWARFLLSEVGDPRPFEQHVYLLDTIESGSGSGLSPMINRYLLRATDIELVQSPDTVFVFTKMARILVVGFVQVAKPQEWSGGRLDVEQGTLGDQTFRLPGQMFHFLSRRADQVAGFHRGLSIKQKEKTRRLIDSNLDGVAASEAFRAMRADVRMFGQEAFRVTTGPDSEPDSVDPSSPKDRG